MSFEDKEKDNSVNIGQSLQKREIKILKAAGRAALRRVQNSGELATISGVDEVGGAIDTDDRVNKLMELLWDTAFKIHATGGLTSKGVASFMLLENRNLKDFSPLDMCIAQEPELAVEAGLCIIDPDRAFGEGLDHVSSRLECAVSRLT